MNRIITPTIIILSAWGLSACTQNKASEMQVDKNIVAVRLDSVKSEKVAKPVRTSGLVSSETESTLSFKTGGIIQRTYVKAGDRVKKDQLLASLNLTEIQAQVVQAKNGLEKATRDLERFKGLLADSAATLEQLQNITTVYENAKESYSIASYNLTNSQIRAGFDGVVLKKWANEGEMISGGNPVFSLSARNQSTWVLKAGVADRDWARLNIGDKAVVHFDHLGDQVIEAEVIRLAQGADPMNGTYQAELQLEVGKDQLLANGLVGSVVISPSKTHQVNLIPIESIIEGNGSQAFVYVPAKGNTVKKQPVSVAYFTEKDVAISAGLEHTAQVVAAGSAYLNEASTIMVVQ
jgi:membrane fusion protein, multidrug efflux system